MEEVTAALRAIQKEFDDQKTMILKSGENITENVTLNINSLFKDKFAFLRRKIRKS